MELHRRKGSRLALAGAVATAALSGASGAQAATVETVARGLDNPRSVSTGPDGAVYIANAGRGGRRCRGRGENRQCLGRTGRIVRFAGGQPRTVAKGFASLAGPGGPFAGGLHGVSVSPNGQDVYAVTGSGPPAFIRQAPPLVRRQAGRLFEVEGRQFASIARIDRFEWNRNLDNARRDRNSNPYAVLALADRQIVVDAGANAVLEVRDGNIRLLAVIPGRRGGRRQAVPTSIALGPDGAYYVGELAESAGKGKARVWRVPPEGGAPTVYRTGFTRISGVAFGPDGSLYVTEFALNETFRGRLVRVAPDGSRSVFGGRKLRAPTGAAVDSAGAVYVSNYSVAPGRTPRRSPFRGAGGTLVKITP
jgi:hypothetical protein